MTGPSDFSDDELIWLGSALKPFAVLPEEIEAKLVESGVIDRTNLGPKITGLGMMVLDEARKIGRLPKRT